MDVQSLQQLVLTRLRANLKDIRTSNVRTDTRKWILSRFPDNDTSKNLDEFKDKFGYPLLIVQTPNLAKSIMYANGGMESAYSMKLHIQHVGALADHDKLVKSIFADFKDALETNFYLENNIYLGDITFNTNDDNYTSQDKVFNSVIIITFNEDDN